MIRVFRTKPPNRHLAGEGSRHSPYKAVYETAKKLRVGQWFTVPGSDRFDAGRKSIAYVNINRWLGHNQPGKNFNVFTSEHGFLIVQRVR